jgi:hypothetical protein
MLPSCWQAEGKGEMKIMKPLIGLIALLFNQRVCSSSSTEGR